MRSTVKRERTHVFHHLSSCLFRRRSGQPVRQGHGSQISRWRPDPAPGHAAPPRPAAPSGVMDPWKIKAMVGIAPSNNGIEIKGATTHYDVAQSNDVQKAIPGLAYLASVIGDPAVRYKGTIGGSIANNDPAADYPAAVLALNATVKTNKRTIAADEVFKGLFTTALQDRQIITAVSFPVTA